MNDTVCIYSGGMDSFTLVNDLHREGRLHSCLSFNYGQRHSKELRYAASVCTDIGIRHQVVDLQGIASCLSGSALTWSWPIPEGHYAEESMKQTVVPNRNMIMLSIAVAYAISNQAPRVAYGAHAGDHTIYPDCRPEFLWSVNLTALIGNWDKVTIIAPYLDIDKRGILEKGFAMGLRYERSWTCYKGGEKACGKCGSCQERLEAFAHHGKKDPLEYDHG
jgi:7-cyano-7-deazaguanine synthase